MIKTLFSLEGRVGRGTYWAWLTFLLICHFVTTLWVYSATSEEDISLREGLDQGATLVLNIVLFWPTLAITVKRWHDVNKSGMWVFINLIPILGWIYAFVYNGFIEGDSSSNRFGQPQK